MAVAPYIPVADGPFESWLLNFSTLITAAPATYGLTAPDAVIIAGVYTPWNAAYLAAIDPITRTSVTIATKDAARVAAEAVVRPYAQQIAKDNGVTNGDKTALGLNLPNPTRPPIPPPLTAPAITFQTAQPLTHVMRYSDTGAPSGKAKPDGSIGVEIWRKVGVSAEVDPANCTYYATVTRCPFRSTFGAPDVGKVCTYFARFVNKSGPGGVAATGPWSAAITLPIM